MNTREQHTVYTSHWRNGSKTKTTTTVLGLLNSSSRAASLATSVMGLVEKARDLIGERRNQQERENINQGPHSRASQNNTEEGTEKARGRYGTEEREARAHPNRQIITACLFFALLSVRYRNTMQQHPPWYRIVKLKL